MKTLSIDLESKLRAIEVKNKPQKKDLMTEVAEILYGQAQNDLRIINAGKSKDIFYASSYIDRDMDVDKCIYSLKSIYKLCVQYRLRFLDLKHFKGDIPYEAVLKMKKFEKEFGRKITACKILAPAELFKLENKDSDPMLFLDLGNDNYYLLHKWGKEMNFFRFIMAIPFRNVYTLISFIGLLAAIIAFSIPVPKASYSLFLFMYSFIAICGLATLYCFSYRKNFNEAEWNSRFNS